MSSAAVAQHALALFGGLGVVLALASLVGWTLKFTVAKSRSHSVIDNLNTRIKAWWVMVLIVGVAFAVGPIGVTLLFVFVSFIALREFIAVTGRGIDQIALVGCFLALPVQYGLVYAGWYRVYAIFIPAFAFLLLPIVLAASGRASRFLERAAPLQWGLMLCVYCLSFVPALLALEIPGYGGRELLLIVFFIVVVQSCDVLQYIWGMLFGRHRVAPALSPSKTWEGLIGGVATATLLGATLFWLTPFSPVHAALMAFAANAMGALGGLAMSAIKRDRGVKDWGDIIDGHGGMLDRVDSIAFAAPVFFHLTLLWTS